MTTDGDFAAGAEAIAAADPAMARLIDAVGPCLIRPPMGTPFQALARAIVFQQLAGRAAAAIHGRAVLAVGGSMTPDAVLAADPAALRAAGLSGAKTASIIDLASRFSDGTVDMSSAASLTDEEIIQRLVAVRGIGRWTAEMFLIFELRRPDVWPVDDLGVRRGYGIAHGLDAMPAPRRLAELGDPYRPHRTGAAWYCWRATEMVLPEAPG